MYLLNDFSAGMLSSFPCSIDLMEISAYEARTHLWCDADVDTDGEADLIASAVGHADTAGLFGELLGFPVPVNQITVTMKPGDRAVLGQYSGPSLPEGATCLPPGASIKWILVTVRDVAVTEFTV